MPLKLNNSTFQSLEYWVDAELNLYLISDMTDEHLVNALSHCREFALREGIRSDKSIAKLKPNFATLLAEQKKREEFKMAMYRPCSIQERNW